MRAEPFRTGKWTISVLREGDECLSLDFLTTVGDVTELKFAHLFKETIEHGPPRNWQRFHVLWNEIYEFKTYNGYRMYCFQDRENRHIFLTHGGKKPQRKRVKDEVRRAEAMRTEYLQELEEEQR